MNPIRGPGETRPANLPLRACARAIPPKASRIVSGPPVSSIGLDTRIRPSKNDRKHHGSAAHCRIAYFRQLGGPCVDGVALGRRGKHDVAEPLARDPLPSSRSRPKGLRRRATILMLLGDS
jgi:hypothetical protein